MVPHQICILLVEDDASLRSRLCDLFREIYPVAQTDDPALALELLNLAPSQTWILVSDLHLQGMSGTDLVMSALLPGCLVTGVVLMSGDSELDEMSSVTREACSKSGVPFKTLKKPFPPEELLHAVHEIAHPPVLSE